MIEFLQNLVDALALGSIYALTALGIGLLFGILRLINFAHGDMITIGAYALIVPSADVTARLLIGSWTPAAVIIAISMIVVVAALITDAAVFRPLRTASSPTLMISSFAVSYIIQNGILIFYGARPKAVDFWSGANVQSLYRRASRPLAATHHARGDARSDGGLDAVPQADALRRADARRRRGFPHGPISWRARAMS